MTEKERYDWDLKGIWDYNDESDEYIESYEDITKLLNKQEEEIQKLEKENQNLKQMMENGKSRRTIRTRMEQLW